MSKYITRRAARGNGICPVLQKWRLSSIFSFIWREFSKRLVAPRTWENEERYQRERDGEIQSAVLSGQYMWASKGWWFICPDGETPTDGRHLVRLAILTDGQQQIFFLLLSPHIFLSLNYIPHNNIYIPFNPPERKIPRFSRRPRPPCLTRLISQRGVSLHITHLYIITSRVRGTKRDTRLSHRVEKHLSLKSNIRH